MGPTTQSILVVPLGALNGADSQQQMEPRDRLKSVAALLAVPEVLLDAQVQGRGSGERKVVLQAFGRDVYGFGHYVASERFEGRPASSGASRLPSITLG